MTPKRNQLLRHSAPSAGCAVGVEFGAETKSAPRRANVRGHGIGTEVRMHAEPTQRLALKRLPRTEYEDQPRYFHPNGYVIERCKRSWSERVGRMHGQADHASPMYWWEVWNHIARRRAIAEGRPLAFFAQVSVKPDAKRGDFELLADARAWCDEHPREGWVA